MNGILSQVQSYPVCTMIFKVSFSLFVITNTKTCSYYDIVCLADIRSGLEMLISFNSVEAMTPQQSVLLYVPLFLT